MKLTIDIKYFAIAIISFAIAFMLMQGTIQKFIYFADPLNEMACCVLAGTMGILALIASFEKPKK